MAPNIIPSEAQLAYYIRATSQRELKALVRKVDACFDAAALATGCEVSIRGFTKCMTIDHFIKIVNRTTEVKEFNC